MSSSTEPAKGLDRTKGRLAELVGELAAVSDQEASEQDWQGIEAEINALLEVVVRLYTTSCEASRHRGPRGAELDLTPTEACTVAAALLRSQLLTPFEFAIWYSGGADNDPGAGPP